MKERIRYIAISVVLPVLAALATAGSVQAHDLFVVPDQFRISPGQTVTIGFHSGDGFPDSTQNPARLRDATVHSAGGMVTLGETRADGKRNIVTTPSLKAGHHIVTVVAAANVISMKPDEFLDYLKEEGLKHVIDSRAASKESDKDARERYTKYAKSILLAGTPDATFSRVVGLPIEIIPEKDPYSLKAGDSLPVRVLVKGKPAAGLDIRTAWAGTSSTIGTTGKTNSEGRLSIPLPAAGKFRLHALHMERVSDGVADWESLWATLTFEIR